MMQRFLIEFVVDVPNEGVARDVGTRLTQEHGEHLLDVLASVMGHTPLRLPDKPGFTVSREEVRWDKKADDWLGEGDEGDEGDDED